MSLPFAFLYTIDFRGEKGCFSFEEGNEITVPACYVSSCIFEGETK